MKVENLTNRSSLKLKKRNHFTSLRKVTKIIIRKMLSIIKCIKKALDEKTLLKNIGKVIKIWSNYVNVYRTCNITSPKKMGRNQRFITNIGILKVTEFM